MTRLYLDTSLAVYVLEGDLPAIEWFDATAAGGELVSSRLLQTELSRVLRREARPVLDRENLLMHVGLVPITESILTAAEAISAHIQTLDAIHLATALSLGSDTTLASHDRYMLRVAAELGLRTLDPLGWTQPGAARARGATMVP